MATVVEEQRIVSPQGRSNAPDQRFVLRNVSWEDYEAMLSIVGDRRIRVTYDRGTLELMSPSIPHEEAGRLFGRFIDILCEELEIRYIGLRSATWRRRLKERGLEADECFYLANTGRILAKKKKVNLDVDPPPDLCIEIEVSRSVVDRLGVYAGLGVPEVWRYDEETLRVLQLAPDGAYAERDFSPSLPFLPLAEVTRLVKEAEEMDHMNWGKRVRGWIREAILPHYHPPERPAD